MKRTLSKSLAWVLTLLMLFTALPVNGLSEGVVQSVPTVETTSDPANVEEDAQADAATFSLTEEATLLSGQNEVSLRMVQPDDGVEKYVTYEFYNGNTLFDTQIVKVGEGSVTVPSGTPVQDGYTFAGWYYEGGSAFDAHAVGEDESGTKKVYAHFAEVVYHVYFLDVDGNVYVTRTTAANGTVSLPGDYKPAGKRVTGWKVQGTDTAFTDSTPVTADVTVVPVTVDGYWVTFDAQGGSAVTSVSVDQGASIDLTKYISARTGYTFAGWTTDGHTVITALAPTTDTTVYALWTPALVNYTVVYWGENADDAEFETYLGSAVKKAYTGAEINMTSADSSLVNQYFTFKEADKAVVKADGSTVVNVYYTRNSYTVTFDLGRDSSKSMTIGGKTYTGGSQNQYKLTAKYEQNIEALWPTASNFNANSGFRGWEGLDSGSTATSKKLTMTADLCSRNGKTARATYNADCLDHLYYMFESFDQTSPASGNDRHYYNGKYYDKSTEYSQDANSSGGDWQQKAITGMKANGTQTKILSTSQRGPRERNVFLYYTRLSYDLVKVNYGVRTSESLKYGAPLDDKGGTPARPVGFSDKAVFKGWYAVPVNEITDATIPYSFVGKTMPLNGLTLYAYWVEGQIRLTVDYGDYFASDSDIGTKISEFDSYANALAAIRADGKIILKWVDESSNEIDLSQRIDRDTTIRPILSGTVYSVTYLSGEGTGSVVDNGKYYYDSIAKAKSGDGLIVPEGKAFAYWVDGENKKYYVGDSIPMKDNVTLTAVYTDIHANVTLTYHANGGNGNDIADSYANNELVTLRGQDTFTRLGYTLDGWNTQANGQGTAFDFGASARVNNVESNDLYAVWTPNADTAYYVEFYYQTDDQSGYELKRTDSRAGTTDTTASVTDDDKADKENGKYVFEADNTGNVLSGNIAADGSLVLKLYFKLNQFSLTIHYVYEDGREARPDYSNKLTVGDDYNVASPKIDGYTADKLVVSGKMPARKVEETVTYTRRSDLSYTVNYYWNNTTDKVAESKTLDKQTFEAVVTESPASIEGYTPVSAESKSITIGIGDNVIDFYYYKNVELTANSSTDNTYDGTEKSVSGFTGAPNDAQFAVVVGAKGTDAGEYEAQFAQGTVGTVDATEKYIVAAANDGKLKIAARAVAFTGESAEKEYNGSEQELTAISADNLVAGHTYEGLTYSAKGMNAGEYDGAFSGTLIIRDALDNDVTQNYDVTQKPGKLTITKAEKLVVTVTGNTSTVDYDGKTQVVEGFTSNAPTGVTVSLNKGKAAHAEGVDVGEYFMNLKAEDFTADSDNYEKIMVEVEDGWLKINPISIEGHVTLATQDVEEKYDGTTYKVGKATATDLLGDGSTLKIEYSVDDENWTTDNTAITAKDVADSKTVQVRVSGSNYTGYVTGTEALTIVKRSAKLISASDDKVYDGTPLTNENVTVIGDGFVDGEVSNIRATGTITDHGSVPNTIAYTKEAGFKDGNYEIAEEMGVLTITVVADKVTVTITEHSGKAKYDGTEKTVTGYDVTSISNELYTVNDFTFTGKDIVQGTDAGSYDMELKSGDFENINDNFTNVEFEIIDGQLEITKRAVTLTSESDEKVYDGTPLTQDTVTVTGDGFVRGEGATFTVTGKQTDVGKSANIFGYTLNEGTKAGNYSFTKETGTLEVTPVTDKVIVTIEGNKATYEYDATEKIVTGYKVVSISNDLYKEENFSLDEKAKAEARGTDAGSYLMGLTALSFVNNSQNFVNVKFVVEDGALMITRRGSGDVKVTVMANDNKGIVYDGKTHGENGYTTSNLAEGQSVGSVVIDGSRIDAGLYEDELIPHDAIIVDVQGNDVTKNYELTYVAGDLEIARRAATVTANDNKGILYDGKAHGGNGYTSSNLLDGHTVTGVVIDGSRIDAGLYEGALVPHDAIIVDVQSNDVTKNYELTYVAGDLEIARRAATVTANDNKGILYDGKAHGGNGYTSSNLLDGHTVTGVVIDGSRIDAGLYEGALVPHDAIIVDVQSNDVTKNYELTYVAGDLEITPIMDEIVVTITGHKGYFIYDGTRKTLMGYEVEVSDPSYALDNIVFTGWARVHGIEPGVYMMGLKEDQFHDKGNYANVKFVVIDGVMTIVRGKHYVAWLHDTSMMINSAEKSDTLTAISNYLERTRIQTVFHSGSVVADSTSQEQWDAFNSTMKHLYDNERRTFIVNGAAQDVVENSLFLDQPFREDYLESDMFEEGKGVVNRFEMGGVKMIMVTLSDDALTEEGLKWARNQFNAESDRVGILMVNTYLTEDKKIAESAEEIEKQIVSVCGNVRLVLSSNAKYNSHESFKYGERTVWALNADIEAATAEGYITLLEFDADARSLYVTTYSPVKNDFVYDDDQLEYEQFTLYNAF